MYSRHDNDEDVEPDSEVGKESESLECPDLAQQEASSHKDNFCRDD